MSKTADGVPFDSDALITLDEAGRMLGISAERVRMLIKAGFIDRPKPGRVSIGSAAKGYARYWQDVSSRSTKTASDTRVRDAKATEIEMRIAERQRKLIPLEDAVDAMSYLVGVVREQTNIIPARATRDITLRRTIEAEVNAAQANIAKALGAAVGAARTGGELPYSVADN